MTETLAPAPAPTSTRRPALVTGIVALVLGLLEAGAGVVFWYLTETDPSDDPLVALGYLVALLFGVPGVLGLITAAVALLLVDRVAGLVLAVVAAMLTLLPLLPVAFFALPSW